MPLVGVVAALVFLAVLLVEGSRRPAYDPIYHTGSELELGERWWIQRASSLLMGVGTLAFAIGMVQLRGSRGNPPANAACLVVAGAIWNA